MPYFANSVIRAVRWADDSHVISDPLIAWNMIAGVTQTIRGMLWDAIVMPSPFEHGTLLEYDSKLWFALTPSNDGSDGNSGNTGGRGTILLRVPSE
jgi:hypothetical protein